MRKSMCVFLSSIMASLINGSVQSCTCNLIEMKGNRPILALISSHGASFYCCYMRYMQYYLRALSSPDPRAKVRNKWTILLTKTYDGSTNGLLRLTAYPHAQKKKKTQTDRNNHDDVIETVKRSSHESVVRPALVKLQLIGAWWFKAPVVFSPWQAAHLSCHLKSEPDAVICVIIQTTRQWMWLYKNIEVQMGLWVSIPMNPQLTILFLLVALTICHSDWATVAFFILYLATIKQKIYWKTGTLCVGNWEWSDSTWPRCLERATWANSAALRRLHKVARSSCIDSVCHHHVEKCLQRYMQQSHCSATEIRAADTTHDRSLWIVPPNPNDAQRCGELA